MLSPQNEAQAIQLLSEMTWPLPPKLFDRICLTVVTVPFELAVIRNGTQGPEILLIRRDDEWYQGWHIPGTVMRRGDTEVTALSRLTAGEVGSKLSEPTFVAVVHSAYGTGVGQNPRGQLASLLYICYSMDGQEGNGKFFPIHATPDDTLTYQQVGLMPEIRKYLQANTNTK